MCPFFHPKYTIIYFNVKLRRSFFDKVVPETETNNTNLKFTFIKSKINFYQHKEQNTNQLIFKY